MVLGCSLKITNHTITGCLVVVLLRRGILIRYEFILFAMRKLVEVCRKICLFILWSRLLTFVVLRCALLLYVLGLMMSFCWFVIDGLGGN